ncbi:MAG: hypothetical protein KY463_10170, partial [Actinobacteria bacterium]|nr:hypothetical protein [Actinomycetota bacterium]
ERVARGSEGFSGRTVGRDIDVTLGAGRRTGRWAWLAELGGPLVLDCKVNRQVQAERLAEAFRGGA